MICLDHFLCSGLMIVHGVTMMALAVVVIGLALANLNGVDTVVGVTDQMKMIGQNHFHQVNDWNSEFLKHMSADKKLKTYPNIL